MGLFAIRNYAAVLLACLFPMRAMFAANSRDSDRKGKNTPKSQAMAIAAILVPLILLTGSRSGMLAATVGLIGGALLYNFHVPLNNWTNTKPASFPIAAATILVGLVYATIYFSRAQAIEGMFAESGRKWTSSLTLFWQYSPYGFRPGSFVQAFQKEEPLALVSGSHLNRLHNDWLETVLTFGVPGVLLMLGSVAFYALRSFILWFRMDAAHSAVALGRMASIIVAILGIASMSDHPLRTPAMTGFAALVLLWFAEAHGELKARAGKPG